MRSSGAEIVKEYLEKYVLVYRCKVKQNKHTDPQLARNSLSIAYDIIHEMDYLILSNNANDFAQIRNYLQEQILSMHEKLKERQSLLQSLLVKTTLPIDFSRCIDEAWSKLGDFENQQFKGL